MSDLTDLRADCELVATELLECEKDKNGYFRYHVLWRTPSQLEKMLLMGNGAMETLELMRERGLSMEIRVYAAEGADYWITVSTTDGVFNVNADTLPEAITRAAAEALRNAD